MIAGFAGLGLLLAVLLGVFALSFVIDASDDDGNETSL